MLNLRSDTKNIFQCTLTVEGARVLNTTRLVLEFANSKIAYMIKGSVNENGKCIIEIPPLRKFGGRGGKARLEIIADRGLIFSPWKDTFRVR